MASFPFGDAPGRKKTLHENVYDFPFAQLQVLDFVEKNELYQKKSEQKHTKMLKKKKKNYASSSTEKADKKF